MRSDLTSNLNSSTTQIAGNNIYQDGVLCVRFKRIRQACQVYHESLACMLRIISWSITTRCRDVQDGSRDQEVFCFSQFSLLQIAYAVAEQLKIPLDFTKFMAHEEPHCC